MNPIFNYFRNIKFLQRRQEKKHQRELLQTLRTWSWLEKVFESGQLSFDYEHHRLFITQPLAVLMMANGADGWVRSVQNIYQYVYFLQTRRAWDDYIHKEELAAVRAAIDTVTDGSPSRFSRADIDRIRTARRMEISQSDMEQPKVQGFEFFILPNSTELSVEPLAVGHFDPETQDMEIAPWSDVSELLKANKEQSS